MSNANVTGQIVSAEQPVNLVAKSGSEITPKEKADLIKSAMELYWRGVNYNNQYTEDQMNSFFLMCMELGLNPLKKEIYATPHKVGSGNSTFTKLDTVIAYTSFITIAERTGLYEGYDCIHLYEQPDGTIKPEPVTRKLFGIEWFVYRKGRKPFRLLMEYDEFYRNMTKSNSGSMWQTMGHYMFWKTGIARSHAGAFPETGLGAVYIQEELPYLDPNYGKALGAEKSANYPANLPPVQTPVQNKPAASSASTASPMDTLVNAPTSNTEIVTQPVSELDEIDPKISAFGQAIGGIPYIENEKYKDGNPYYTIDQHKLLCQLIQSHSVSYVLIEKLYQAMLTSGMSKEMASGVIDNLTFRIKAVERIDKLWNGTVHQGKDLGKEFHNYPGMFMGAMLDMKKTQNKVLDELSRSIGPKHIEEFLKDKEFWTGCEEIKTKNEEVKKKIMGEKNGN